MLQHHQQGAVHMPWTVFDLRQVMWMAMSCYRMPRSRIRCPKATFAQAMNQSSHAARDDKWSTSAPVVWKHVQKKSYWCQSNMAGVDSPLPKKTHTQWPQALNRSKELNRNHAFWGTFNLTCLTSMNLLEISCWVLLILPPETIPNSAPKKIKR